MARLELWHSPKLRNRLGPRSRRYLFIYPRSMRRKRGGKSKTGHCKASPKGWFAEPRLGITVSCCSDPHKIFRNTAKQVSSIGITRRGRSMRGRGVAVTTPPGRRCSGARADVNAAMCRAICSEPCEAYCRPPNPHEPRRRAALLPSGRGRSAVRVASDTRWCRRHVSATAMTRVLAGSDPRQTCSAGRADILGSCAAHRRPS